MKKVIIKESQYNTIISREKETRLNAITDTLKENDNQVPEVIEEGFKDFVLGAAMVISQALGGSVMAQTGHNKDVAEKAVKNDQIMSQIKTTLDDELKTKELADAFKKLGFKDPDTLMSKNAEKIKDAFNKIATDNKVKYRLDTKAVTNLQDLGGKLKQGYALKDKEVDTNTIEIGPQIPITVNDTIDIDFGSDKFFITGGYELSPAGIDSIKSAIIEIKNQGGKILSVNIESSTDAEHIRKYITQNDVTGNIQLAQLRSKSISDLISTLVEGADITHREIPNNGSDVVTTKQFIEVAGNPEATAQLRVKTSEFRYAKLTIVATYENKDTTQTPPVDVIKHYRFELVKVVMETGKKHKIKTNVSFKHSKFKCKKNKTANGGVDCFTF